jgi:membrane fusion protein, multidrug efflux system
MEQAMYRERDEDSGFAVQLPIVVDAQTIGRAPAERQVVSASAIPLGATEAVAKHSHRGRRRMLIASVAVLLLAGGGWYGTQWWTTGRFLVSTDDAYVRAHNTTLASKISGYVASIPLDDNAKVRVGDVIATIDDGDYRIAVEAAQGKVATQQATVDRIGQQIVAQHATIAQARAQLMSAQAGTKRMQLEFDRQHALEARQYASRQTLEQSETNRDQATAAERSARSGIDAAEANLDVLKAQQQEAARTFDELKTALAKAERDLSFAVIRAPVDGVFGNRAVQTGDFVQPGQRIASLVPLSEVFIDANFKETQLARVHPGQPVSVSVDALPGPAIEARVESVSPASGSIFSLLPPDNATGNFTKIVQRLPVRIVVPAEVARQQQLRPGMSVIVSVNTKAGDARGRAADVSRDSHSVLAARQ